MSFFSELKRRNVFRVAAAYLVGGWLLIEVSATLEETLRLPEWADTLLAYFLILGFPIALFFSWAYEITPDGIKREKDVETTDELRAQTAYRLNWIVIILLVLTVSLFVVDRFVLERPGSQQVAESTAPANTTTPTEVDQTDAADLTSTPNLSIAVLPFINMSADEEQEYFSDGLTEELLNLLAGIEQLKVAARTSSFYYKDKLEEIPLTEIAGQLEVAHILEGSVRKSGNRIRITAQLIKADDGFHLWSNTWDRTLDDIFAIQDEIAATVTDELKITLLGEAPTSTVMDPESYELALHGRYLFGRRLEGDLEKALELFERAVELDPNNAMAWIGAAPLYLWLFEPPRVDDALKATERAISLEPENPEAWSRKANAYFYGGKEDLGWEAWNRALELGQDSPLIQSQRASELGRHGDLQGAIEVQKRAVALDPLYLINIGNLVNYLVWERRYEEASEYAQKMLTLEPTSFHAIESLAQINLLQGNPDKARELIGGIDFEDNPVSKHPDNKFWWITLIEHSLGNTEAADEALENYVRSRGEARPLDVAFLHAWRGDKDEAFEWLNRTLEEFPEASVQYSWAPWLDSLKDDPRWRDLMTRWTGNQYVEELR